MVRSGGDNYGTIRPGSGNNLASRDPKTARQIGRVAGSIFTVEGERGGAVDPGMEGVQPEDRSGGGDGHRCVDPVHDHDWARHKSGRIGARDAC